MSDVNVKILGISGTIVKDGNCDIAVKEALQAAAGIPGVETEFITLADKKIAMCQHCQYCIEKRVPCKIEDDATWIIDKMIEADGYIWGAPVWSHTISPLLADLVSRARYYCFYTGDMRNKVLGTLVVSWFGVGEEMALMTLEALGHNYLMLPVFRGWAKVSRAAKGERPDYSENGVLDDTAGMVRIRTTAQRVVEISKKIKYANLAGVGLPPEEERSITCGRFPLLDARVKKT